MSERASEGRKNFAGAQPIVKNVVMLALSLGYVGLSLACYLSIKGVFAGGNEFNSFFNGIYLWELAFCSSDYFATAFATNSLWAAAELVPLVVFTLAAIGVVLFCVFAGIKKYFKIFSLVWGVAICALSLALFFVPYINIKMTTEFVGAQSAMSVGDYLVSIVDPQYATLFVAPAIGVVQLALAIAFMWNFGGGRKKTKEAENEEEQ